MMGYVAHCSHHRSITLRSNVGLLRSCLQMHVEHRECADLADALRAAEAAVKRNLGYTVSLLEKPLYDPHA